MAGSVGMLVGAGIKNPPSYQMVRAMVEDISNSFSFSLCRE